MFGECLWLYLLILHLDESILSNHFPARSRKYHFISENSNSDQNYCYSVEKNEPVGFSGKFKTANIQVSLGELLLLPSVSHFSHSVVSDSLQPHRLQNAKPPCPSLYLRVYSNSCPLSWWCHPTISSSAIPFFSHPKSFPASMSFQMSQFFASGGQSISVSASVLPMNIQDWFPLRLTGWISLQSKWLSRVFSNSTAPKHQNFGAQLLYSPTHIDTWLLEKP